MTSAKDVILTSIKFKGLKHVRSIAGPLSEDLFCSRGYVLSVCRKVETGKIKVA